MSRMTIRHFPISSFTVTTAIIAAAILATALLAGCNSSQADVQIAVSLTQTAAVIATDSAVASTSTPVPPTPTAPPAVVTATPVNGGATSDDAPAPAATFDARDIGATGASLAAYAASAWNINSSEQDDAPALEGVFAFPVQSDEEIPSLWVAHTLGMRSFNSQEMHSVAIFTWENGQWQELGRVMLGTEDAGDQTPYPDYLGDGAVRQINIEPSATAEHIWLTVEGGVGAHSGVVNLLSFDGATMRIEASGFSSSPGVAEYTDLNGDGNAEMLLDATDYYVFCYACGVRLQQFSVLHWNGTRMEPITLQPLPATDQPELKAINDRAVELAQAGLWKDALATALSALDLGVVDNTYDWNLRLIQLNAGVKRGAALDESGGYSILDNIFYGDYPAAVDVMRPYAPADIFNAETPLIIGTPAEGSTEILADWISRTAASALTVMPDLAPAIYLQGWAAFLQSGDVEAALDDVARAAALAPDDALFRDSVGYLLGDSTPTPPADVTATGTPTPEISATVAATERAGSVESATATPEPTPEPAPATPRAAFGRLFYSAQNADGQTAIFQLDPDSGTVRQVVDNAAQPALQPGGDRLAFHSTRDDMLGLGGYDLGVQERVRFSFNTEDTAPTWDPAVQQLLFASTRYGDGRWRLYSVWADGRGDAVDLGYGQDPDWHPNEALIVFKGCDERGGRCGLWTMAPDGSARRPLTDNPGDAAPDWSPNGQYVVFMSNERDGNWELYRVDVDSGAVLRLTDDPANDGLPAVSPDGREVAYMTNQGGAWSIQVISIDGSIDGGAARTLVGIGDNVADWLDQGVEWER